MATLYGVGLYSHDKVAREEIMMLAEQTKAKRLTKDGRMKKDPVFVRGGDDCRRSEGAYFGHSRHPFRRITRQRIGRNPASGTQRR